MSWIVTGRNKQFYHTVYRGNWWVLAVLVWLREVYRRSRAPREHIMDMSYDIWMHREPGP